MAEVYDAKITGRQNADFYLPFVWEDLDGAPIDITGGKFWMTLRQIVEEGATPAEFTLSTDLGTIPIIDGVNGRWAIDQDVSVWQTWPIGRYSHDLVYEKAGRRSVIWKGTFTLKDGVTDAP